VPGVPPGAHGKRGSRGRTPRTNFLVRYNVGRGSEFAQRMRNPTLAKIHCLINPTHKWVGHHCQWIYIKLKKVVGVPHRFSGGNKVVRGWHVQAMPGRDLDKFTI